MSRVLDPNHAEVDVNEYDEFLDKLKQRVEQMSIGPADQPDVYMGPVISAPAPSTATRPPWTFSAPRSDICQVMPSVARSRITVSAPAAVPRV